MSGLLFFLSSSFLIRTYFCASLGSFSFGTALADVCTTLAIAPAVVVNSGLNVSGLVFFLL